MAQHKSAGQVSIANGASLSSPISLGEKTLCGVIVPPSWTAAGLSFQASDDGGATWANVFDSTGAEVTIASAGIVAGQRVSIDPKPFAGIDFLKVRSGTGASPVNQGGARALTLISRKVYPLTFTGTAAATGGGPTLPVLVAHTAAATTDTTTAITSPVNSTGGTFAVIVLGDHGPNTSAVISDSQGNTWNALTPQNTTTAARVTLFYATGLITGVAHTFTATGTGSYPSLCVLVFSGITSLDVQNGAVGVAAASTIQPGTVTPTSNGEVIVTGMALGPPLSGASIGSGFTISDTSAGVSAQSYGASAAYLIQATAAAVNPTWTFTAGSGAPVATMGAFK